MKTLIARHMAGPGLSRNVVIVVAGLLAAIAMGGWATMTTFASNVAVEEFLGSKIVRRPELKGLSPEEPKPSLTGSYQVTGTDSDGKPYVNPGILDVSLAPSGALELEWDNGRQVGIGQVYGSAVVVACLHKGRTAILIMSINPDGSLSGNWFRRTDRGYKGTEMWRKK